MFIVTHFARLEAPNALQKYLNNNTRSVVRFSPLKSLIQKKQQQQATVARYFTSYLGLLTAARENGFLNTNLLISSCRQQYIRGFKSEFSAAKVGNQGLETGTRYNNTLN